MRVAALVVAACAVLPGCSRPVPATAEANVEVRWWESSRCPGTSVDTIFYAAGSNALPEVRSASECDTDWLYALEHDAAMLDTLAQVGAYPWPSGNSTEVKVDRIEEGKLPQGVARAWRLSIAAPQEVPSLQAIYAPDRGVLAARVHHGPRFVLTRLEAEGSTHRFVWPKEVWGAFDSEMTADLAMELDLLLAGTAPPSP